MYAQSPTRFHEDPKFKTEPPPDDICEQLTRPSPLSCDPDNGIQYFSYNGVVVHECAHRVGDERSSYRHFVAFSNELMSIQDDLRYCGAVGACSCNSQDIKDRIARALARLKGRLAWRFRVGVGDDVVGPRGDREDEAETLECAYYTALCRQ